METTRKRGYTLWEQWMGKVPPPPTPKPEDKLANHLHWHIGDFVQIDLFGPDKTYVVSEVREYSRSIVGNTFKFSDYVLRDGDEVRILRANPREGTRECDLLLLEVKFEGEFDPGIADAFRQKEVDTPWADHYWMLKSGAEGFLTNVRSVSRDQPSMDHRDLRYWDFYRKGIPEKYPTETADEDVFLFGEFSDSGGYTTILEGHVLSPKDVCPIPAGQPV